MAEIKLQNYAAQILEKCKTSFGGYEDDYFTLPDSFFSDASIAKIKDFASKYKIQNNSYIF